MQDQQKLFIEALRNAKNILVTVGNNPTVDQLSATIGLSLALNKLNKHASAVYSGVTPSTIQFLRPEETLEQNTDSLRDFIIALDKNKADRLRYKVEEDVVRIFITPFHTAISEKDLDFSQGDFNIDLVVALGISSLDDIDAAVREHGRILHDAVIAVISTDPIEELGTVTWVEEKASSLSEMVLVALQELDKKSIEPQTATALLTGIVSNTERFSNDRTTPVTMSASASLMAAGANQQLITSELETPPPEPEPIAAPPVYDAPSQEVVEPPVMSYDTLPDILPPVEETQPPDASLDSVDQTEPVPDDAYTGPMISEVHAPVFAPEPLATPDESATEEPNISPQHEFVLPQTLPVAEPEPVLAPEFVAEPQLEPQLQPEPVPEPEPQPVQSPMIALSEDSFSIQHSGDDDSEYDGIIEINVDSNGRLSRVGDAPPEVPEVPVDPTPETEIPQVIEEAVAPVQPAEPAVTNEQETASSEPKSEIHRQLLDSPQSQFGGPLSSYGQTDDQASFNPALEENAATEDGQNQSIPMLSHNGTASSTETTSVSSDLQEKYAAMVNASTPEDGVPKPPPAVIDASDSPMASPPVPPTAEQSFSSLSSLGLTSNSDPQSSESSPQMPPPPPVPPPMIPPTE